jgi:hypothetical protein
MHPNTVIVYIVVGITSQMVSLVDNVNQMATLRQLNGHNGAGEARSDNKVF